MSYCCTTAPPIGWVTGGISGQNKNLLLLHPNVLFWRLNPSWSNSVYYGRWHVICFCLCTRCVLNVSCTSRLLTVVYISCRVRLRRIIFSMLSCSSYLIICFVCEVWMLITVIFGRPFVKRFALCYWTIVLSVCLSCLDATLVYCGQMVGWIKAPLGTGDRLRPCHIVLDGDPTPPQKKNKLHSHQFLVRVFLWPNGWMDQDATW